MLDGLTNGERATVRWHRRLAGSTYSLLLTGLLSLATAVAAPGDPTDDGEFDNRRPRVVEPIENQVIEEDSPFRLNISGNFEDPDGDPLIFVGDDFPGSLTLSQAGVISGTPTQDDVGRYRVRVVAIDPSAEFAVDRFRIDIVDVNDPPTIVRQRENPLRSREDEVLRVTVSDFEIVDPDSSLDSIRLELEPGANYTLVSDDQLRPATNYNGSLIVPVVASDGIDDSNRFLLNVQVTAVNDAPRVVSPIGAQTTNEDQPFELNVANRFSDVDGDTLRFSATGLPGALSITEAGLIRGTPRQADVGQFSVTVTARDPGNLSATQSFALTVRNVNDPPVITGQQPLVTNEDTPLTIRVGDLIIQDPDNGPADMQLRLFGGANYTLSGTTVRPAENYFGTLTVPAIVNDGRVDSDRFSLKVTVRSVNDRPVIVSQTPVTINEDTNFGFNLGLLSVTDPDDVYPDDFGFTLAAGQNYTVRGDQIRPRADFSGTLTVGVTVNDGTTDSASFPFKITVREINDAPAITGQRPVRMDEDTERALTPADLIIVDPDDPTDSLTMELSPGANYRLRGNVVIPAENFNGTLSVPVRVRDEQAASDVFDVAIQVVSVNDLPVIMDQRPLATDEDTPLPIALTDLMVTDPDNDYPADFSLRLLPGANYTTEGNTVIPAPDFDGDLAVPAIVNDGADDSAPFTLKVAVGAVNDAPEIKGQTPITIDEDSSVNLTLDMLIVDDPDDPASRLRLIVEEGENYTLQNTRVTPAENFSGALTVPVAVTDGQARSEPFDLLIEVRAVNDPPVITGQLPLTTTEDSAIVVQVADLLIEDPDDEVPNDFTLSLLAGENYTVNGDRVRPNEDFSGDLSVGVTVNDGDADSEIFALTIVVTPFNDPPAIVGQRELITEEDTPLTITVADLLIEDPDNVFPDDFSLTLAEGQGYTLTGNTVRPDSNFNGRLDVPARVDDGSDTSDAFMLRVEVRSVNDVPHLVEPIPDQQAVENEPFFLRIADNFEDSDGDEITFELFGLPADSSITLDPVTGILSGTPDFRDTQDFPYDVIVVATDENGGSGSGEFQLTIAALDRANVALSIGATPSPALLEDEVRWALTVSNAGPTAAADLLLTGEFAGQELSVMAGAGADCAIRPVADDVTGFECTLGALAADGETAVNFIMSTTSPGDVVASGVAAVVGNLPIDPNKENNEAQESVSVARRLSNGAAQTLGSANVLSTAVTDANGDGALDLVFGTAAGEPAELYYGEGSRTMRPEPRLLPDNAATRAIGVADLNDDGREDLVLANGDGAPDHVLFNDGVDGFVSVATFGGRDSRDVVIADFDGDGRLDLAFAAVGPNPVYFDNGVGAYVPVEDLGERASLGVDSADFDGDGWPDLVYANSDGDSTIYFNDAGNGFGSPVRLAVGRVTNVVAADLNGDERPDLAFAKVPDEIGDVPANPVLINDGSGQFTLVESLGASPTLDVLARDMDDDGFIDLFFVNATGTHQTWRGRGSGFALADEQIYEPNATSAVIDDIGNDGGMDIALGTSPGGGRLLLNDSFGSIGMGDAVPPIITLLGEPEFEIPAGSDYDDPGFKAMDNIDGDISESVVAKSTVDSRIVGLYKVVYTVTDKAGNAADPVSRTVRVTPAEGGGGGGGGAFGPLSLMLVPGLWAVGRRRRRNARPDTPNSL